MNSSHEAISAFLDDEPFDPEALAEALSDPAGRALLIDSIVLRRILQPIAPVPVISRPAAAPRSVWRTAAAAAALLVALAGGYMAGDRRASVPSLDAPPPTRVVQAVPFVPSGGM